MVVAASRCMLPARRGLAYSCFRMTVLFVLCHGVWNKLNCVASQSFLSVDPPHANILEGFAIGPEEDRWPLDLFSNYELSASMGVTDPPDPFYIRSIRDSSTATDTSAGSEGQKTIIRACSNRLRYILTEICDGHFHNPTKRKKSFLMGKRNGFVFRRVQRAVVSECCNTPCSMESLRKYCKVGNGQQSSVGTPSATVMSLPEEVIKSIEDTEEEVTPSPTPAIPEPTEPALFSIIRFINYMMNRQSSNRKPKMNSSGERNVGLPQPRIQDELGQTFQSVSGNRPVRIGSEEPTNILVLPIPERSSQEAFDPTIVINEDSLSPSRSSGHHHHHHPTTVQKENVHPIRGGLRYEHEMGRNAVTSTLPPLMIRVGPLRSDFLQRNFALK